MSDGLPGKDTIGALTHRPTTARLCGDQLPMSNLKCFCTHTEVMQQHVTRLAQHRHRPKGNRADTALAPDAEFGVPLRDWSTSSMSARSAPAAGGSSGDAQAGAEKLPSCEPDSRLSAAASSAAACASVAADSARLSSSTVRPSTCCSTACRENTNQQGKCL